jgi:hypothetical protein
MHHVQTISKKRAPAPAISLLEKQAMTDMIQRNLSQVASFISIITGLKNQ